MYLILLLSKLGKGICFLGSFLHSELGMIIFKFKIFKSIYFLMKLCCFVIVGKSFLDIMIRYCITNSSNVIAN